MYVTGVHRLAGRVWLTETADVEFTLRSGMGILADSACSIPSLCTALERIAIFILSPKLSMSATANVEVTNGHNQHTKQSDVTSLADHDLLVIRYLADIRIS